MKQYISPYLFFFVKDDQLVAWDYKNHQQYQLETKYLLRLLAIASGDESSSDLDDELFTAKLISTQETKIDWGWDLLSQIFHIGIQNVSLTCDIENHQHFLRDYVKFCGEHADEAPQLTTEKDGVKLDLPMPDPSLLSKIDLWSVLNKRKTSRSFEGKPASLITISTVLYTVFGNIHPDWDDLKKYNLRQLGVRKSSPSAGALHPCEAYLLALRVENLAPGVYHYQSHNHVLTLIQEIDMRLTLGHLLAGQDYANGLSAGIFISARFEKNWHKYRHSRGYVHPYLDAGHLSQTFQLCVTALGLQPWLTGAFLDDEVCHLLKLENSIEHPIFFVGLGQGDGNSLSKEMQEHFSKLQLT